jgi:hypothetical protein
MDKSFHVAGFIYSPLLRPLRATHTDLGRPASTSPLGNQEAYHKTRVIGKRACAVNPVPFEAETQPLHIFDLYPFDSGETLEPESPADLEC